MQPNNINWPEIYSIGPECIERYVNSRDVESPLEDHDIIAAGISDLTHTYDISRSSFIAHVVIFTVDGLGIIKTPEYKRILNRGDIILVPAGCPARYQLHGDTWKTLWFDLANVEQWSWLRNQSVSVHKAKNLDSMVSSMNSLYLEVHNLQMQSRALSRLLIEQIIIYLKRELQFEVRDYENHIQSRLDKLFQVVNRQLQNNWNVDKLAAEIAVSPSHLYTLCRKYLGINPMKRVTELRMQRARLLLYQTNASVSDIANIVGYQNQFNFSTSFKKHTGISPTGYRNRTRNTGVF